MGDNVLQHGFVNLLPFRWAAAAAYHLVKAEKLAIMKARTDVY